jgi:hypothetical protein
VGLRHIGLQREGKQQNPGDGAPPRASMPNHRESCRGSSHVSHNSWRRVQIYTRSREAAPLSQG